MPAFRGPDGKIVYASDEDSDRFEAGGYERVGEAAAGAAQNRIAPVDNGITGSIGATVSAGLSGATLGASDWLLKGVLNKGQFGQLAQDRADNPILASLAQGAGAILPALVSGGSITPSGYLSKLAAGGIEAGSEAGGAIGAVRQLTAAGAEGAIQNAGVYLSDVALGDRDLTAEGMTGALGTGLAFGSGGLVAMHGIVGGTVAARRMFARYAQGGERAAADAMAAWQAQSAKTLEAFDQTATAAETKLQEAQLARQQADLARKQAASGLADARAGVPPTEPGASPAAGAPPVAPPSVPPEVEIAGLLRDRAVAAMSPDKAAAWSAENGPRLQELMSARMGQATAPALPPMTGTAVTAFNDLDSQYSQLIKQQPADLADLSSKLAEYQDARRAFSEVHASVDPELEAALTGMRAPETGEAGGAIGQRPVPVGEFGAPGARGYNPGEVAAPGPPSQAPLASTAEGTPVTRALRKGAAGEPTTAFDFKDSGLTFDPATRNYSEGVRAEVAGDRLDIPKVDPDSEGFTPLRGNGQFRALGDDEFEALQKSYKQSLTADERSDAQLYAGGARFRELNGGARHGVVHAGNTESASKLDALIAKSPTEHPIQVARVVGMENGSAEARKLWEGLKPGDVVTDGGWQSTTTNFEYANTLGDVMMIVDVPKGYPAAPMPGPHNEWELVLRRDTSYRVKSIRESDGKLFAHVEVVPVDSPPSPLKVLDKGESAPKGPAVSVAKSTNPLSGGEPAAPHVERGGDDLMAALRGTKSKLDAGESASAMGGPARAEYRTAKAARSAEAADHFRAKAIAGREAAPAHWNEGFGAGEGGYEASRMAGEERAANAPREVEHPLATKQLEVAHDAALERAAAAKTEPERAAATAEAKVIERQLTQVGAKPGAVEDVAAMAPAIHWVEKAAADLTEALGESAPAAAVEHAKAFREAEDAANAKSMARTARAADDHAAAQEKAQTEDFLGPSKKDRAIAGAKQRKLEAEAAYAKARVSEAEASIGAKQAAGAAQGARDSLPPMPGVAPTAQGTGIGHRVAAGAHAIGYAAELGSDLGIPGIPRPHDIPVIGPLLSAYLKYRAFRAAAGRFAGRIPVTAETRAAELAARTRDGVARAVDRSLGLIERSGPTIRRVATVGAIRANEALSRRAFDDGEPDAPAGASVQQQAAVRMREIAAVAANPQLITDMVRKQTRDVVDPDLITALENHLVSMFQHLSDAAPKGPPPNPYSKKEWLPSPAAALQFGQRLAVANNPQVAFELLEHGALTPPAADTFRAVYDKLFAEAQKRIVERAADIRHPVEYRQLIQNSLLFDAQLHESLDPENATILATAHAPSPPANVPQPSAPPMSSVAAPTAISKLYASGTDRSGRM